MNSHFCDNSAGKDQQRANSYVYFCTVFRLQLRFVISFVTACTMIVALHLRQVYIMTFVQGWELQFISVSAHFSSAHLYELVRSSSSQFISLILFHLSFSFNRSFGFNRSNNTTNFYQNRLFSQQHATLPLYNYTMQKSKQ